MNPTLIQAVGALLFATAILHTFSTGIFARLARKYPKHAGFWNLFTEAEFIFSFWAAILILFIGFSSQSARVAIEYLNDRNFTEPLFVFVIMVVAASRPVLQFSSLIVRQISRILPLSRPVAVYVTILAIVPLLASFITEPAAMTLAALMLRELYYSKKISSRLMYATIGVLFVNVSIGGTLTNFAAPPVLMVAHEWGWDSWFMLSTIGWRSALAVFVNAIVVTVLFRKELGKVALSSQQEQAAVPGKVIALHVFLLFLIVLFAHDARIFISVLLIFLALAHAYPHFQDRLILREGLMVGCFLGGLVTLGGQQEWWLRPLFAHMNATSIYYGATALTAVTDNAALTYLGTLVPDLTDDFKYALVSGAVTGGGLTVIANAPNPAGMSILHGDFKDGVVKPLGLLIAATPPTIMAILAFRLFPL
ncbi:MAG: putative Na+/H+ antiporter [Zoogloeaceae bacterium]|jgi:Na+/H+ antiporter NhaD/arsenite permease-like protein|nr:putative Na+/H+ antiporter [Zoogloeaceae bacterium]